MLHAILKRIARLTWIRFGIRGRFLRLFVDPETTESTPFTCEFYGDTYSGNLNSYIDWCAYFFGLYEKEYLEYLATFVAKGKETIFIDVGANVGHHSIFMSRIASVVHSFEPNPTVRKLLEQKIHANSKKNIVVHDVGLGKQDEGLDYFTPTGANHGTGSFVKGYSPNNENSPTLLQVVNGDKYITKLNLPRIDLVKIDVEGFEKNVLIGLKETLILHRPVLAIEFSKQTRESFVNLEEFQKLLPADYLIEQVVCNAHFAIAFNKSACVLEEFDFNKFEGNLLVRPG